MLEGLLTCSSGTGSRLKGRDAAGFDLALIKEVPEYLHKYGTHKIVKARCWP